MGGGGEGLDEGGDFGPATGAEDAVDARDGLGETGAATLGEAARGDEALTVLLVAGEIGEGVGGLLFGGTDEAAGVDDEKIGVLRIGR